MKPMKFNAKKDTTYRVLVWGSALLFLGISVGLFVPIYNKAGLAASLIVGLLFGISGLIILWFWYSTYYILTDDTLIINLGPFKRKIALHAIKKIEKTNTQLASVALAKERYYLYYNANDYTIIAPENINKFVQIIDDKISHSVQFIK